MIVYGGAIDANPIIAQNSVPNVFCDIKKCLKITVSFVVNCKMIYFIYKTPDFQPALLGCICATVRGCAVFVLPTSLLMEAQVEFVAKAGFLKSKTKLNTSRHSCCLVWLK